MKGFYDEYINYPYFLWHYIYATPYPHLIFSRYVNTIYSQNSAYLRYFSLFFLLLQYENWMKRFLFPYTKLCITNTFTHTHTFHPFYMKSDKNALRGDNKSILNRFAVHKTECTVIVVDEKNCHNQHYQYASEDGRPRAASSKSG